MVWGLAWLSRTPVALPSSRLLRLLRLRLLSMEVMLEEEVVRERVRRVIPADGTETQRDALKFQARGSQTLGRRGRCSHSRMEQQQKCLPCKNASSVKTGQIIKRAPTDKHDQNTTAVKCNQLN